MLERTSRLMLLAAVVATAIPGCHDEPGPTALTASDAQPGTATPTDGRYVVVFAAERIPADFVGRVAKLAGSVDVSLESIGVATVTGLTPAAAGELATDQDIQVVEPDVVTNFPDAGRTPPTSEGTTRLSLAPSDATASLASASAHDATSPTSATLYPRQWNMRAVVAPEAWATGHLGSHDVVVAILDTGIDYLHPDMAGLVDLSRSKSFVPEDEQIIAERFAGRLPFSDLNGHGTAVASIVASNATTVAGVSRHVTLLAVKIFDRSFQGPAIGRLLAGIVYAADQGADVINVSRADTFDKSENPGIVAAVNRAANYAFRKGALIVSIAGNDDADLDHDGDSVRLPCEAAHVLCVSATGPTATAGINGPWESIDARAPYSAFGRSAVDVAAPGGAGDMANQDPVLSGTQFRRIWAPCTTTPTENSLTACVRRLPVAQPFGTSFAAPHVSGLAALLVAQRGHGEPAMIRARILDSADDVGEPGTDPYYGRGRINIARALGVLPRGNHGDDVRESDVLGDDGREDAEPARYSDWSAPVNLGPIVNSAAVDIEVSVSRDGRSLYIASNRNGGFDIWVSRRSSKQDPWGPPQVLGPTINTPSREQGQFLSLDGHRLFFFSDRDGGVGGTDLYVARRRDKRDDFAWQPPENLGSDVNSTFTENLSTLFEDTLYFNSNRPGIGGTDIYASALRGDGTFAPAVLVPELSSPLQDAGMAIRRDGLELILASTRTGGFGGFDLWSATRPSTADHWSTPVNLGPIVNSAAGESRVALSFDGTELYIISDRPGGSGALDLWISTREQLRGPS